MSISPQRQPATRVHPISGSKYPVPRGADRTKIETFLLPQSEHSNALLANHRKTARPLLDQMCLAKDNKTDPSHTHTHSLFHSLRFTLSFSLSLVILFQSALPKKVWRYLLSFETLGQRHLFDSLFFGIDCNNS